MARKVTILDKGSWPPEKTVRTVHQPGDKVKIAGNWYTIFRDDEGDWERSSYTVDPPQTGPKAGTAAHSRLAMKEFAAWKAKRGNPSKSLTLRNMASVTIKRLPGGAVAVTGRKLNGARRKR